MIYIESLVKSIAEYPSINFNEQRTGRINCPIKMKLYTLYSFVRLEGTVLILVAIVSELVTAPIHILPDHTFILHQMCNIISSKMDFGLQYALHNDNIRKR